MKEIEIISYGVVKMKKKTDKSKKILEGRDLTFNLEFIRCPSGFDLRNVNGLMRNFQNSLFSNPEINAKLHNTYNKILEFVNQTDKQKIKIAFVCKNGKHRSVAFSERIFEMLAKNTDHNTQIFHYI